MQNTFKGFFSLKLQYVIVLVAAYYSVILNRPLLSKLFELADGSQPIWFTYTAPLLLFSLFLVLFTLVALPYVFKPFVIFLTLTSAAAMLGVERYNILLDTSMMENVFETNVGEASTYLNASSALFLFIYGVLPSLLLAITRIRYPKGVWGQFKPRLAVVLIGTVGMVAILGTQYKNYASIGRNNHYLGGMIIPAQFFNSIKYLNKTYFTKALPYIEIGQDATLTATQNNKPTLLVMILGETARAQNFAYNGYERNTNPYTQSLNLIAAQNVTSCGTHTALSVPCMFSDFTQSNYDKAQATARDTVVDVIAKAGVETLWIDNDGGDKAVAQEGHIVNAMDPDSPFCFGDYCHDESMLKTMKAFIEQGSNNKFLVLHSMGSHGPTYWQRYPDSMKVFQPSCDQSDIEHCSDEAIRNVYDNTIVYTDYFIAQVIDTLKQYQDRYNVALTYLSDHGESLGENGLYLHGTPYSMAPPEQTHVPWLFWLPESYLQAKGLERSCIEDVAKNQALSHDYLFHSLLGLYGINTQVKDAKLNVFERCAR